MTDQLESMKASLMACAMGQMGDLGHVNAEELGEVIDMIKDLEEAQYYCSITKAMKDREDEEKSSGKIENAILMDRLRTQGEQNYYGGRYNRMYYDGNGAGGNSGNSGNYGGSANGGNAGYTNGYSEQRRYTDDYRRPYDMRDYREGRSGATRKGYMEGKEQHRDKSYQMQELESYVKELGEDITEMISGASPEEKKLLKDKLTMLTQKIV